MTKRRTVAEMAVQQLSVAEAAYVAGVIDGEGTITLTAQGATPNRPNRYTARLQISNTDLGLLERINGMVGGGRYDGKTRREGVKPCYALTWTPTQIRQLLPQLLPYLISKQNQAKAVLRFFDLTDAGAKGAEAASLPEIEAIRRELKRLNHRGASEEQEPEWEMDGAFTLRKVFREQCEHCGTALTAMMPHKRFCSEKCQAAHYQATVRGPAKHAALVHEQACEGCGKVFETDYRSRKFCGKPCYLRHRRQQQAAARVREKLCPICGTAFEWKGGKKTYCSAACVTKAYARRKADAI